jgi:hypothetical protein
VTPCGYRLADAALFTLENDGEITRQVSLPHLIYRAGHLLG